jgi:hypothetical protein
MCYNNIKIKNKKEKIMKEKKDTILRILMIIFICFIFVLILWLKFGTKEKEDKMKAYVVYQNDIEYSDFSIEELNNKKLTETILLLEVPKDCYTDAYGLTGAESDENSSKIYYDVYKIKSNNDKYYIYYHIVNDEDIDINSMTLFYENLKEDEVLTIEIPKTITNISDFDLDTININNKLFIYNTKSEEQTKKKDGYETDIWFTFIPLNCSKISSDDLENIEIIKEEENITYNDLSILTSQEIMNDNTSKSNVFYSPLNTVIKTSISYKTSTLKENNISINNIIENLTLKIQDEEFK